MTLQKPMIILNSEEVLPERSGWWRPRCTVRTDSPSGLSYCLAENNCMTWRFLHVLKSLQRHRAELNMGHHKAFQCENDIQIIQIVFNGLLNPSWLQPFNMYTLYFVLGWGMADGGHKARLFGCAGTLTLRRAMWCPSRHFTRRVLWSCGASTNTSL